MEILLPLTGRRIMRQKIVENRIKGDHAPLNGRGWSKYGVSISEYDEYFKNVLKNTYIISLMNREEPQIIIDLMAPSGTLASAFRLFKNKTHLGIALTLEDMRSDERKKEDENLHIKQLTGDVMDLSTWQRLREELKDHKANLILQRSVGGIRFIHPSTINMYQLILRRAWNLLTDQNGILLTQTFIREELRSREIFVADWVKYLKTKGIEAEWEGKMLPYAQECFRKNLALKLVKTPDSPKKLPFPKSLPVLV